MSATTIYGIKNCDTVRKARKYLESNGIDHQFHDFRADGLSEKKITQWCKTLGWEKVLNKRSTSWKALSQSDRDNINEKNAIKLMSKTETLVKRPVLEHNGEIYNGFSEKAWQEIFNK